MNKFLQWMKGNAGIVIAMVVAFLCVAFVAVTTFLFRGKVIESVENRVVKQINEADGFLANAKISLPGAAPGSPMESKSIGVATPAVINSVKAIWAGFASTGKEMRDLSRQINGQAHESAFLLPETGVVDAFNQSNIRAKYRNSFIAALWNPKYPAPGTPALSDAELKATAINPLLAGQPWTARQLQELSDSIIKERLKGLGFDKLADLSETQRKTLETETRRKLIDAMKERAQGLCIYAETDQSQPGWPLSGMWHDWGREGNIPSQELAYESQADVWVLRDLVEALRVANHVGENGSNVLNAPVKRLIRMQAQRDGYVGLHTMGMVVGPGSQGASAGSYPVPTIQFPAENLPQFENFFVSPTGRMSNAIYDVKHTKLEVIADIRRLPELLEAIASVNMMTVVDVAIEDVDEYKELREGLYCYGACDVAKVTLVVESLWMRSWTAPRMPAATRNYLKLAPAVAQ